MKQQWDQLWLSSANDNIVIILINRALFKTQVTKGETLPLHLDVSSVRHVSCVQDTMNIQSSRAGKFQIRLRLLQGSL